MTSEPGRAGPASEPASPEWVSPKQQASEPASTELDVEELEPAGQFEVEGVLTDASNLTARVLYTAADGQPTGQRGLYKPIRGEAPLRDFPEGTLGRREVAAFWVSEAGGWGLIPRTIMSEGPLGPGSVQRWIDWESTGRGPGDGLLEIFPAGAVPSGWLAVVHGDGAEGQPVAVAHQDAPDLASLAVLDVVLNNADRKGAHLVRDAAGHLWAFDHGLTLHAEDKLRTVLWGWAGQPLPADDVERLQTLRGVLDGAHVDGAGTAAPVGGHAPTTTADSAGTAISALISPRELQALSDRVDELLAEAIFPALPTERYALPWPLW